jgi:hypothetical protein
MAISPDEIDAVLRLRDEHQRILNERTDWMNAAQEAADRMRDIADPPYLREMREAQERMRDIVDPPALRQFREEHQRMLDLGAESFAKIQPLIDREMFSIDAAKNFAAQHLIEMSADHLAGLKDMMTAAGLSSSIAKSLMAHDSEIEALTRSAALFRTIEIPDYMKEVHQLSVMSIATEEMMATIQATRGFADLLDVHDVTRCLVEYETGRLNRAYAGFSASIVNRPEWLASAPDFVRRAPGDMIFTQARFVRTVTTHEVADDESAADEIWAGVQAHTLAYIEAVLPELNPNLIKSWQGAWDTAKRRGPDWARHSASSIRFLLSEVLTAVAPPDKINKAELPKEFVKDGQIQRLGQIHWLCGPLQNRSYGKVVRADLDSAMTIVSAMNEAVHEDHSDELEEAFRTMAVRAAVALCNLLKLWKARD